MNARIARTEDAVDYDNLRTAYNYSIGADEAWHDGYSGKGVGVAVIDTGIAGGLRDFRAADSTALPRRRFGGRQPGRRERRRRVRPRHARRRPDRGQRQQPPLLRPEARQVPGRRARGQPDRRQGRRRGRLRDGAGRHRRPSVRGRQQARLQHPRRQPLAALDSGRVVQDRPARRGGRGGMVQRHRRGDRRRQPGDDEDAVSTTRPPTTPT